MKAIWFTVVILATALALAIASLPAAAETAGEASPPYPEAPVEKGEANEAEEEEEEEGEPEKATRSPILLKPKYTKDVQGPDAKEPPRRGWSLSFLGHTPLIKENDFDTRFRSFGGTATVSFFLTEISNRLFLYAEGGAGATFSSVEDLGVSYGHVYFDVPVRLRLYYPLGDTGIAGEVWAGLLLRFLEWNNDPTLTNGPLFSTFATGTEFIQPDVAVGLSLPLSREIRGRLLLGYLFLTLGIEIVFDSAP